MTIYDMLEKEKIVNFIHQNNLEIEVLKHLFEWLMSEHEFLACKNMQQEDCK